MSNESSQHKIPAALDNTRSIVIVGGGFAGATVARRLIVLLKKRNRNRAHNNTPALQVIMVSEESYTTFNPMLPEAVGSSVFPEQIVAPLRHVLSIHQGQNSFSRFIMARVEGIDRENRLLHCQTLSGQYSVPYEHLVLAFGNRARLDLIPGAQDFALPLKTVGDALHIRNHVLRKLAQTELCQDKEERKALSHFVVIGGGFSGVEVAGELASCLQNISRYYPKVDFADLCVTLLHDMECLLPELPKGLGERAKTALEQRGVVVKLSTRAINISENQIELQDGTKLNTRTIISTIGTKPNSLVDLGRFANQRGRISTDHYMRVLEEKNIWALGDCAAVPNAQDGKLSPPTAQFAVRQGRLLANNIVSVIEGHPPVKFSYQAIGMMAAIGSRRGVAQIGRFAFSGLPAWLLWRAYYLSQLPTLGRKVRIFVEWTWGMFFPVDITHIRFFRSKDLD